MSHLFRVIVPVTDINHAARFYGALLNEVGQRVSPGRHYFNCEGTILACYDPQADGDGYSGTPCLSRSTSPSTTLSPFINGQRVRGHHSHPL